jgi:polysulfide reductase chain C
MQAVRQSVWRIKIAIYLFLAGMGAGSIIVGVVGRWMGHEFEAPRAVGLGVPAVCLSTVFLLLDLGRPGRFFLAARGTGRSWISRGFVILCGLVVTGGVLWLEAIWPRPSVLIQRPALLWAVEAIALVLAVAAGTYTGILIAVLASRPFWNNPLLPVLFLVSALSTGIGAILVAGSAGHTWLGLGRPLQREYAVGLASIDMALLALEAVTLYLYLSIVSHRSPALVRIMLRGALSKLFWWGLIVAGLLVPLALEGIARRLPASAAASSVSFVAGGLILSGGFILRHLILCAGTRPPLIAGAVFHVRPGV